MNKTLILTVIALVGTASAFRAIRDEPPRPSAVQRENGLTFVNATLVPQEGQAFTSQVVRLYPGWDGVLDRISEQIMVPEPNSVFNTQHVRVFPSWYRLNGPEGALANVYFPSSLDQVTIYFDPLNEHIRKPQVPATEAPKTDSKVNTSLTVLKLKNGKLLEETTLGGFLFPTLFSSHVNETHVHTAFDVEQRFLMNANNVTVKVEIIVN